MRLAALFAFLLLTAFPALPVLSEDAATVPHRDTTQVNINVQANAYDSNGNSAYGNGTATGILTHRWYEAVSWSESHPYFSARYTVRFPLFDASGQPFIKADAKSITLHIITPNGEKDATFDLAPKK